MFLEPHVTHHGNCAVVDFVTRFGKRRFLQLFKKSNEIFKLSYTALDQIIVLPGQIKSIWPKYVEVHTIEGVKRAIYDKEPSYGEEVFIVEYFPLEENFLYKWAILSKMPCDVKCIYVNMDTYDIKTNEFCRRFRIDIYTGEYLVINNG